jgi:hypothetical protein
MQVFNPEGKYKQLKIIFTKKLPADQVEETLALFSSELFIFESPT